MYQAIIVVHVLLGLGVIGLVLLQQGKGADAGAAFGSASSGSVFGAQGASSFLSRATAILATLFFLTSMGLAVMSGYQGSEVDLMDGSASEDIFADVPLVQGDQGSSSESMPVISDDLPAMGNDISKTIDTVSDSALKEVEAAEDAAKNVIDNIKSKASELSDAVSSESERLAE